MIISQSAVIWSRVLYLPKCVLSFWVIINKVWNDTFILWTNLEMNKAAKLILWLESLFLGEGMH